MDGRMNRICTFTASQKANSVKMCGWNDKENNTLSSAIEHLEKKFKIPYDQRGAGDAASWIFDLNPKNHHFKSLGHNPTLLGLFFSILDQFCNTSHFVSNGELISLQEADGKFELKGNDVPSKLFCGFANWFGHIISDISGSSGTKGRGMGIPSPIWSWTNDIIAIKRKQNIPVGEFDKSINELALEIYKQGYDSRFQVAQAIPVFINELLVRVIYSVRRLVKYFTSTKSEDRSFSSLWKSCEPFSNATVKRMLTVAHGTFCLIDTGDAVARGFVSGGGSFNVAEFAMRLNIVGIGRFTISLYGEAHTGLKRHALKEDIVVIHRQKIILEDYIEGLNYLAEIYDDKELLLFTQEFRESDMYIQAFKKSILLAQRDIKSYELAVVELKERISRIIDENAKLNDAISNIATLGLDYSKMTEAQQYELGAYVNLMNASTQLLINPIKDLSPKFSMTDLDGFMAWKDRKTDKSIYEDNKDFIVSLANLLYKIELDDREKKLLWKSLRKNKKMLKSMDISKKEFDMDLMNGILDALRYKYIQNEKLV